METERRLIDANELPLGKFAEPRTEWHKGWNDALDAAMSQAPTVDAVEVVRCKDCKHCKKYKNRLDPMLNHQLCVRMDNYAWGVEEDDFCSYGERRPDA